MIRHTLLFSIMIAALGLTSSLHAGGLVFESGPNKMHLLELFTSEGCSSCPPAEAWLSKLKDHPRLWRDFVPVAFHVDYWDRLGWRDPFASKAWTARQYACSAAWKNSSVYTPGFVLDAREWRNTAVPSASGDSSGTLKLSVTDGEAIAATFQRERGENKPLELHVARLGFGLRINVGAGENSGRKLLHDFVVLSLETTAMIDGKAELHLPIASGPAQTSSRAAVVAWITEPGGLDPIQATGGWQQ